MKNLSSNILQIARSVVQPGEMGLFRNSLYIFGANILPGLFGAIFWWIASKFFSPAEVGIASAVISAGTLIAMISRMGLDISIIRFLPTEEDQPHLVNSVITANILTCIVASGVFLLFIDILSPELVSLQESFFPAIGLVLFSLSMTIIGTFRAVYVAMQQARYSMYTSLINNFSKVALIILSQLVSWISIVGAATWGLVLSVAVGVRNYLPSVVDGFKPRLKVDGKLTVRLLPYSFGNFFADLVMQAPITLLPLLILNILGEVSNGHAYVALMMGSVLGLPGLALSRSAFAEGANRLDESGKILKKAALVGGVTTIGIAVVTLVIAPWILLVFGQSYANEATSLLRWLAIASPFGVLVQIYYNKYKLSGEVRKLVVIGFLQVIMTLGSTILLMPSQGVSAAGIGTFLGHILAGLVLLASIVLDTFNRKVIKGHESKH